MTAGHCCCRLHQTAPNLDNRTSSHPWQHRRFSQPHLSTHCPKIPKVGQGALLQRFRHDRWTPALLTALCVLNPRNATQHNRQQGEKKSYTMTSLPPTNTITLIPWTTRTDVPKNMYQESNLSPTRSYQPQHQRNYLMPAMMITRGETRKDVVAFTSCKKGIFVESKVKIKTGIT